MHKVDEALKFYPKNLKSDSHQLIIGKKLVLHGLLLFVIYLKFERSKHIFNKDPMLLLILFHQLHQEINNLTGICYLVYMSWIFYILQHHKRGQAHQHYKKRAYLHLRISSLWLVHHVMQKLLNLSQWFFPITLLHPVLSLLQWTSHF